MKPYVLLLCMCLCYTSHAQNLFGYIKDKNTGESISDAVIFNDTHSEYSNSYGYYSIVITSDSISVSAYGYTTVKRAVNDAKEGRMDICLESLHSNISEITVKSKSLFQSDLKLPRMSRHSLTTTEIKDNVAIFGEADALKTIQNLPGVASAADGSVNLSVRGSSHDQNMILIDEATVYNPSHALGLFSGFNPDAISNVSFYKSGYSPKYGGKLAAIVDIHMKEGSNQQVHLDCGIGNVVSRLVLQAPIVKNTGSLMIAGRYGDGALVNTIANLGKTPNIVKFYDICAKTNWNLSSSDRIYASAYVSHDKFKCTILLQDNNQKWGNKTATIRWNHIYKDNLFSNLTVTTSSYKYIQQQDKDVRDFEWKAGQSEITFKLDFDHYLKNLHFSYGTNFEKHRYNPGEINPLNNRSAMLPHHMTKKSMTYGAFYINSEIRLSDHLYTSFGARLSAAYNSKKYYKIEPRLAMSYSLSGHSALKISYNRTAQFDHMLTNSALSMPTDIWMPISSIVAPQTSNTFSVGIHSALANGTWELFCEGYYKNMQKIIDYCDNANLLMNEDIDLEVKEGVGRAYGIETMAKYEKRAFKAQISYTLSLSKRRTDEINGGHWYYAVYDQRHNLSATTTIRGKKNEFSFVFKYHTGGRATVPYTTFSYYGTTLSQYTERNGYVMPVFHRLDFSWRHNFETHSRYRSYIVFSLYNCYGRKNAYSVFVKGNEYSMSVPDGYMMYLYQWMPSLTYCFGL
ncbi:MAG: TonB-dependent receptor plug domain-containing protein [Marinilabiliaceae bacterium]|nr:TonB-dependent receptor plug domain-containing protein [Marinilabiliaceae bacterium]